jgi:hypothetical protein
MNTATKRKRSPVDNDVGEVALRYLDLFQVVAALLLIIEEVAIRRWTGQIG